MFKKVLLGSIAALLLMQSGQADARVPRVGLPAEQAEDFRYYQQFRWDSPLERKAMYEAYANGQVHMFDKMQQCSAIAYDDLEDWLVAFKGGQEKVLDHMSVRGLLDMDGNEIRIPLHGDNVADWLTKDFAQQHYQAYTGLNLRQLQDKYWGYCLAKLPVELYTQEGQRRARAWDLANPVIR